MANKQALTRYHPNCVVATEAWNTLTDTEMLVAQCFIVPDKELIS